MSIKTKDVQKTIKEFEKEIRAFGVKEIYLFGSVVRGDANEFSDVDMLVIFEPSYPASCFTLVDLEQFLSVKLKARVDLGTKLYPLLREQIMQEALRVA